jgi:hypothetical protein
VLGAQDVERRKAGRADVVVEHETILNAREAQCDVCRLEG